MKIIYQDGNRLEFKVYPEKYYIIALLIGAAACFGVAFYEREVLAEMIFWLAYASVILVHLSTSLFIPTHISIDKAKNLLVYRDNSLFPILLYKGLISTMHNDYLKPIKIEITQLAGIDVKWALGGIMRENFYNMFFHNNMQERISVCFIMKDNTYKYILPGLFNYRKHKAACKKISEFLNIPFKDSEGAGDLALH